MIDRLLDLDGRFVALAAALLVYGMAGSPTPDHPGLIEALIGILLICSISVSWRDPARVAFIPLLVFGMTVPMATAVWQGQAFGDILRDIIPFLFLCLPFFVAPTRHADTFVLLCCAVGLLFAMRVLGQGLGILPPARELLYLANSPLVLMTAIIGLGGGLAALYRGNAGVRTVLFLSGGAICLLAMLIDVQRATISAVAISLFIIGGIGLVKAPARMIWPLAVVVLVIFAGWDLIATTWHSMAGKTALVGVNMRWHELVAVYDHLRGNWGHVLFGIGWGGHFESPAVGGWSVPYTHSLLSYMMLKTGIIGTGLTIAALINCLNRIAARCSILSLALFWAILIPVFFYASYKSLDFGLVLVLAVLTPHAIASRITK